jgi:murein DD-endopeptidase MepM/ murein hydrolase activator NlpD
MNRLYIYLIFIFSLTANAQDIYPKNYFASPLQIPLQVSGIFGELRNNHFHSGIDFKTQQKEGIPIFAVADGYISRIKISAFGYGKAYYITHPNGYTTVYGHLMTANSTINAYVKNKQYEKESFEIDIFPKHNELTIKKNELIGYSGNSGSSFGPHLHFEFRDTQTEEIINPLHFGLETLIVDTKAPIVNGIRVYPISEDAVANESNVPLALSLSPQNNGAWITNKVLAKGAIGFSINTDDKTDGNFNNNGVYEIEVELNGKIIYQINFDRISFDHMRFVNAFMDFTHYKNTKQHFHKLFQTNQLPMTWIQSGKELGIVDVLPNMSYNYKIQVTDFHGNKTLVHIPIEYSAKVPSNLKPKPVSEFLIKHKRDHAYSKEGYDVFIPAHATYEDFYLNFDVKNNQLVLHDDRVPVHTSITISKELTQFQMDSIQYWCIASLNGNKLNYHKTYRKGNKLTIYPKNFGTFLLVKDTLPPKIVPLNIKEGAWLSKQKDIQFKIEDDFAGIGAYAGFLNDQWVLFEYDAKSDCITHDFDDNFVKEGRNELKIIVEDNLGNSSIFETHFFRSQKP